MNREAVGAIVEVINNIPPAEFKQAYYDVIRSQLVAV
jgi:hypothetical protein